MTHTFKNIYYTFKPDPVPETNILHSIWDVQADDTYDVINPTGFEIPGAFVTYSGSGMINSDAPKTTAEQHPGSIYIVKPNAPCRYWCPNGKKWLFYFIKLTTPVILQQLDLPFNTPLPCQDPVFLKPQGERIIDEMLRRRPGYALSADIILRRLLLTATRQQQIPSNSVLPDIITWMHRNLNRPINILELQQQYNMGRTSLFKSFKQSTGQSPVAYFLGLKLESARLQLETTSRMVHQISSDLGFYDEFHFSRMFKQKYGHAPGAYRISFRNRNI